MCWEFLRGGERSLHQRERRQPWEGYGPGKGPGKGQANISPYYSWLPVFCLCSHLELRQAGITELRWVQWHRYKSSDVWRCALWFGGFGRSSQRRWHLGWDIKVIRTLMVRQGCWEWEFQAQARGRNIWDPSFGDYCCPCSSTAKSWAAGLWEAHWCAGKYG